MQVKYVFDKEILVVRLQKLGLLNLWSELIEEVTGELFLGFQLHELLLRNLLSVKVSVFGLDQK